MRGAITGSSFHNETLLLGGPTSLEAEELEPVIAPGVNMGNHNETLPLGAPTLFEMRSFRSDRGPLHDHED